jgi:hypothetical protein
MARRGKKKSLARRIRRLLFLASATAAIVRFAMARRPPKPAPSSPRAPEWAPLRTAATTPTETKTATRPAMADADDAPSTPLATASVTGSTAPDWVDPVGGSCPATHPVKGNGHSKIYHVPGGRFYDSTVPERCYRDPQAAEADGMRASKR